MDDIIQQIQQWATEMGATHARVVTDRKYLKAHQAVRNSCLSNACGKSGRSWTCPPYVGELEELGAKMLSYENVVVVQYIATLEDSWDFEGMADAAKKHNDVLREIRRKLVELNIENLTLGCGGCGFCEKCTCPDDPCRFPDEALGSVEGYGLDVQALVHSVGLQYINGVNTVSYVGAVFT